MEEDVTLTLTHTEAQDLLSLLNDDLPTLEREVARTEFNRRFRRFLAHRRDNIEHVRDRLAQNVPKAVE
jgi:hypothetical protein